MSRYASTRRAKARALPPLLLCAALLSACSDTPAPANAGLPEVSVVTVQSERVTLVTELPGRASAYRLAELRPQVGGIVQKQLFEEGAEVKAGQALYQIDPAPYQAALASARAQRARAQASTASARLTAERYRSLIDIDAISRQELDQAEAALLQAQADVALTEAALQAAQIDLDYTRIAAPISGRIGRSTVTVGALVTANQADALATIQQLDPIYVDFTQSSTELLRLKRELAAGRISEGATRGAPVQLRLEDSSPYPEAGVLQLSEVAVDPGTGTVSLRAVVPNPQALLMPGMVVRALLAEGTDEAALLAPQRGVTRNARGEPTVLLVGADNIVQQRVLRTGRAVDDRWLVLEGLAPGDRIVVDGLQRVHPGSQVKPVEFAPAPVARAG